MNLSGQALAHNNVIDGIVKDIIGGREDVMAGAIGNLQLRHV